MEVGEEDGRVVLPTLVPESGIRVMLSILAALS